MAWLTTLRLLRLRVQVFLWKQTFHAAERYPQLTQLFFFHRKIWLKHQQRWNTPTLWREDLEFDLIFWYFPLTAFLAKEIRKPSFRDGWDPKEYENNIRKLAMRDDLVQRRDVVWFGPGRFRRGVQEMLLMRWWGQRYVGLGGGGFMLVRGSDGTFESIGAKTRNTATRTMLTISDFRETAPVAAFEDMYQGNAEGSILSGLASGVPGDIAGLEYLHKKYGALPWRAVCNPAIHAARYGFPVTNDLVRYMGYATSKKNNFLVEDPQWAIDFAPNGTLLGEGDILTRKRYANTLEIIAEQGARAFYEGEMGTSSPPPIPLPPL
ncbi:hypothetical protein G7Y89_g15388 [Cudoniella acicularis]|uniref:Uncharacterized protein n=1 Tax=Cudoniella acicularis TaxID=354080 RepID=A0A8H4QNR9_9HELO|nr:hypothetical protein G7Y89_g15388 [Cudoniella acicularis]